MSNATIERLLKRTAELKRAGAIPAKGKPPRPVLDCKNRGEQPVGTVACPTCRGGRVELKVFSCAVFGTCTVGRAAPGVGGCCTSGCRGYAPPEPSAALRKVAAAGVVPL